MSNFEGYDINDKNQIVYRYKGIGYITDKTIDNFPSELYDHSSRELLSIIAGINELPDVKPTYQPPKIKGMGYHG
jgi:hypothetical protein